ncbi:hypothetical protein [Paenibacillus oleatilyticus]|uniref:hypothetical protein n=1 Tax=Paenibacillus oleatilyticus TaxID=2594886 RepID=UPI001C1F99B0|nr:hypothetical protein [Paenibacillus oleatilyticus]MBU7314037.1 hypothetical protein [Paenibacillus oleatilyticus]
MQESQFFTWEALSAMGGASLLTFFFVQYFKSFLDRIFSLPTDIFAVIVAFFVLLAAQFATGASAADWRVYGLTFANSFLVASAAAQIQNKSISPPRSKSKKGETT